MTDLLNDRYELGEVVGAGGMGAVHRATDTRLGRTVAIKVLRGGALADDVARARMRSEARLASSVRHPGVAQVYDYDAASASHGGMSFIVMEYIDGQSLSQLLREHGPMPVDQVMSVVQQVAEALAAAHRVGIVHRDLKPANIMLTPAGRTVLVDFGIASSASSEPLTETGSLLGTADYLSPEQAAGRPATSQSDLYALGIVAHHCLTGHAPFRRESPVATALAQIQDELPPLGASVPGRAARLVAHLTEKSPVDRPASAADVALEAAAVGATNVVDQPPTETLRTQTLEPAVTTVAPAAPHVVRLGNRRRPLVLYSGAGVVVAALLLLGVHGMGGDEPRTVPDVVGLSVDKASTALAADDLTTKRTAVDSPGAPAGEVVRQNPAAGSTADDSGVVVLTVASGKVTVAADSVLGTAYTEAAARLEKMGLDVVRQDAPSTTPAGTVTALDHSGRLADGSTVTLTVATAPAASTSTSAPAVSTSTRQSSGGAAAAPAPAAGASGKGPGKVKTPSKKAKSKSKSKAGP